jgi:fatty acid desaturase
MVVVPLWLARGLPGGLCTRRGETPIPAAPRGVILRTARSSNADLAPGQTPLTTLAARPIPANDYARLKRQVAEAGLLDARPAYYWLKTAIALGTVGAVAALAILAGEPAVVLAGAVLLGFASTQVALLSHDVGHRQGYRGARANFLARHFFGGIMLGVSSSWWTQKHNAHHAFPNHLVKDPDIQFPMIAFDPSQVAQKRGWLRPFIGIQAFVLCALLPFQAVNIRVSSVQHLLSGRAPLPLLQGLLMAGHFALYGALLYAIGSWPLALGFAAIHHAVFGVYLQQLGLRFEPQGHAHHPRRRAARFPA